MELAGAGEMAVRLRALAAQVYGLYLESAWTRKQCFPQTATGEDLDRHAFLRGIDPAAGQPGGGDPAVLRPDGGDGGPAHPPGDGVFDGGPGGLCHHPGWRAGRRADPGGPPRPGGGARPRGATCLRGRCRPCRWRRWASPPAPTRPPSPAAGRRRGTRPCGSGSWPPTASCPTATNKAYYAQEALGVEGVTAVTVLPKARGLGTVDVVVTGPQRPAGGGPGGPGPGRPGGPAGDRRGPPGPGPHGR